MKVEYELETIPGQRTGSVEGLIYYFPARTKPGETALSVADYFYGQEKPIPQLIMINPLSSGGLSADAMTVRSLRSMWAGIFTADTSINGISHYASTMSELALVPNFLCGRIENEFKHRDKEELSEYIRQMKEQQKLHLRFGRATVTSGNILVVEVDLTDNDDHDQLVAAVNANKCY